MADLLGVDLARPGTYKLSSGTRTFTVEELVDAARFASRPGARQSAVKIGHTDKRFTPGDGEPALGWLGNLRMEEDDEGPVLRGDLTDMPEWLAAAAPKHWPHRSVEGWTDYVADGEKYRFVIDGLALLGATPPGITSLRSLRDLPAALGIAASARIVASMGDPLTAAPDSGTDAPPPPLEGAAVDSAKLREALGLPADASDEEVRTSLTEAGLVTSPPAVTPAPQPVAAAAKPGTMTIDVAAWDEQQERIKRLEAADVRRRVAERDQIIAKAVQDGKFPPARREHWQRLWDADPEGTRVVLDGLARNVMPVMASGYDGGPEELDDEFAHLFPNADHLAGKGA
jgi:hypothetical protein